MRILEKWRRVSWIIYLTDPDEPWTAEDGGALELYPLVEGACACFMFHVSIAHACNYCGALELYPLVEGACAYDTHVHACSRACVGGGALACL